MTKREIRTLAEGFALPECLRWHDGRLYFSDMHGGRVVAMDEAGHVETVCAVDNPAGLGWLPDGTLVIAQMRTRRVLRLVRGELEVLADLSDRIPWFINDLIVDPRGNIYVGHIGFDWYGGESFKPASLWRVKANGDAQCVVRKFNNPNGPAISDDGRTLIVADTTDSALAAFDIAEDGLLGPRRLWASCEGGLPDGIALDRDGDIWMACLEGHAVWRAREGVGIVERVPLPRNAFACAVGGAARDVLYIGTASSHDPDVCRSRRDGRIEAVRLG